MGGISPLRYDQKGMGGGRQYHKQTMQMYESNLDPRDWRCYSEGGVLDTTSATSISKNSTQKKGLVKVCLLQPINATPQQTIVNAPIFK
jgi:hypothetical protein